jgi:hypothetical protein
LPCVRAGAVDFDYLLPASFPGFSMSDHALWSVDLAYLAMTGLQAGAVERGSLSACSDGMTCCSVRRDGACGARVGHTWAAL